MKSTKTIPPWSLDLEGINDLMGRRRAYQAMTLQGWHTETVTIMRNDHNKNSEEALKRYEGHNQSESSASSSQLTYLKRRASFCPETETPKGNFHECFHLRNCPTNRSLTSDCPSYFANSQGEKYPERIKVRGWRIIISRLAVLQEVSKDNLGFLIPVGKSYYERFRNYYENFERVNSGGRRFRKRKIKDVNKKVIARHPKTYYRTIPKRPEKSHQYYAERASFKLNFLRVMEKLKTNTLDASDYDFRKGLMNIPS